jgi:phosphomannomutase / phosphoglucomutase
MDKIITMELNKEIFRAYDIRGIVGKTLTTYAVTAIGQALGTKILAAGETQIVVARDGRLSGKMLLDHFIAGVTATGCNVLDLGEVATPLLYFASDYLKIPSAMMLTGSHNPPDYNGLKIILSGKAIYGAAIQAIYTDIAQGDFATGSGLVTQYNIIDQYINYIAASLTIPRKFKIVVDCGNGIAGAIAPQLYQHLGAEVIPLYCTVDGNFPNHHPDPGDPKNLVDLIAAVREHNADLGFAFDGDGDRLGVVDNNGKIIWPDRLLMLFAADILARNKGATIIYDIKSTSSLADLIRQNGGEPLMWQTGHSLIKAKMRDTGALLAGEMSGHIFIKERWFGFDDALYAGARLLEILSNSAALTAEIFASLPEKLSTPELTITVSETTKFAIIQQLIAQANFPGVLELITLDGLRVEFADGWGLVRASNTTPKLILRFEADTAAGLARIQAVFKQQLLAIVPAIEGGPLDIPF